MAGRPRGRPVLFGDGQHNANMNGRPVKVLTAEEIDQCRIWFAEGWSQTDLMRAMRIAERKTWLRLRARQPELDAFLPPVALPLPGQANINVPCRPIPDAAPAAVSAASAESETEPIERERLEQTPGTAQYAARRQRERGEIK